MERPRFSVAGMSPTRHRPMLLGTSMVHSTMETPKKASRSEYERGHARCVVAAFTSTRYDSTLCEFTKHEEGGNSGTVEGQFLPYGVRPTRVRRGGEWGREHELQLKCRAWSK